MQQTAAPEPLSVLSLQRCREVLGPNCPLKDAQLERLRDELTALADISLEEGLHRRQGDAGNAFHFALTLIPREQHYEIEERAAILEVDGGLQRVEAEDAALKGWAQRAATSGSGERLPTRAATLAVDAANDRASFLTSPDQY